MLTVDREKCTRCGICEAVCPRRVIGMEPEGPAAVSPEGCIACGHCVAVCPAAALDNERCPLAAQAAAGTLSVLDAAEAERFLRARRSTRCYQERAVERGTLAKLLDIARYAPTGGNSQGLAYVVISDAATLRGITAAVIDWLEVAAAGEKRVQIYTRHYRRTGEDVILRGAPHFIVATAAEGFAPGRDNTRFSLAYAELFAPALGLGTCWAGFVDMCAFAGYQPLLDLLAVPAGRVYTGAIMAGYPRYVYHRLVERQPLSVEWR